MTTAKNTKIKIPAGMGEELTFAFSGDEPETYKVTDNTISVPNERVETVLGNVPGSEVVSGTPAVDTTK